MKYSRFNININKEWVHYSPLSGHLFSYTNGAHEIFCWVLCCEVFKFWVNSFDGLWNKEWQEPKLGYAHGTPNIIQGHQKVKAWGCPGRHPLFRLRLLVTLPKLYFYSLHDMCFAWSILYDLSLWFLVYHNHPCCTHLLRETHMNWKLLEYSMCFTYIFWAW